MEPAEDHENWNDPSYLAHVRAAYTGTVGFDEALQSYREYHTGVSPAALSEELRSLQHRVYSGALSNEQYVAESSDLRHKDTIAEQGRQAISNAIVRAALEETRTPADVESVPELLGQSSVGERNPRSPWSLILVACAGIAIGVVGTLAAPGLIRPDARTASISAGPSSPPEAPNITSFAQLEEPPTETDLTAPAFGPAIKSETVRALNSSFPGMEEPKVGIYGAYGTDGRVCLIASWRVEEFTMSCVDTSSFPVGGLMVRWQTTLDGQPYEGSTTWNAGNGELETSGSR